MITVLGSHDGRVVARLVLGHGQDPAVELAARGWRGTVDAVDGVLGDLVLRYVVEPAEPVDPPLGPEGPGLTDAERARGRPAPAGRGVRRGRRARTGCC